MEVTAQCSADSRGALFVGDSVSDASPWRHSGKAWTGYSTAVGKPSRASLQKEGKCSLPDHGWGALHL